DPDHATKVRGRRTHARRRADSRGKRLLARELLRSQPLLELALELGLPRLFLGLKLGDLAADRAQERASLAELAFDRGLGGPPFRHDLRLRRVRMLQTTL